MKESVPARRDADRSEVERIRVALHEKRGGIEGASDDQVMAVWRSIPEADRPRLENDHNQAPMPIDEGAG